MSNMEKSTETKEEKVMTKYDQKMQKRAEEKAKEKTSKQRNNVIGIVVLIALICLVASFPIRTYLAVHENIAKVGGEDVSKVELDYYYNVAIANYVNQYGNYLSYMGLDLSGDLSTQMYSDTMSWKDYFEEMAVNNIISSKALLKSLNKDGFTYDTSESCKAFQKNIQDAASEAGVTQREYLRNTYGPYATLGRIAPFVKDSIMINAYYGKLAEDMAPTDEDIQKYYDEHVDDYDSVDYYLTTIDAKLPTEPTELADPVEETEEDEDTTYKPSEAEIKKAMADAKEEAQKELQTIRTSGELRENNTKAATVSLLQDWLFDAARKDGDSKVVEDSTGNRYYVVSFKSRYLNNQSTADVRAIMIDESKDAQEILDEWKSGAATEESFGELATKYSVDTSSEGGLFKELSRDNMAADISEWLFAEDRAAGDTEIIPIEGDYTYILYYVGENRPSWKSSIASTLLTDKLSAHLEESREGFEVEDPKGNLNYLKARKAEELLAQEAENADAEDVSDGDN